MSFFKGATTMKRAYQVIHRNDSRALTDFLRREGSALMPLVGLIQRTEMGVDELIADGNGRG
jgi:hypothetical protein